MNLSKYNFLNYCIFVLIYFFFSATSFGQVETNVQIKVFDTQLNPIPRLEIIIDELQPVITSADGIAYSMIPNRSLPPAKIVINHPKLEAESWNYSKGTLEIIVREKKEKLVIVKIVDRANQKPVSDLKVSIKELQSEPFYTDNKGNINLVVPVEVTVIPSRLFDIEGHEVTNRRDYERGFILEVEKIIAQDSTIQAQSSLLEKEEIVRNNDANEAAEPISKQEQSEEIDINELESINSLTILFSLIKKLDYNELDSATQKELDDKFYELSRLNTLSTLISTPALELINDSSIINDDLLLLIEKIQYEGELLTSFRDEFELAAEQIKVKLGDGGENLSDDERQLLVQLIFNLKELLQKNEEQFYRNNEYYQHEIKYLQSQLTDILELEDQLIESEEAKRKFREQLIYTSLTLAASIGLVLLLIFLIRIFISQRKELEKAKLKIEKININLEGLVRQKTDSLAHINNELDTFIYRSSHNLRRPITSMKGLANVAELSLNETGVKLFQQVTKTSNEMEKMIDKLGMMNYIHQPTDFRTIDFEQLIANVKTKYLETIGKQQIQFEYVVQPELQFKSYPFVIELMMQNLVENAVFYCIYSSSDQPHIRIAIERDDENKCLLISVHDNGCGIDKEVRDKIWDMFFIGNVASNGNGLGLYITKKAVESLEGSIDLDTKAGLYSNFKIVLPYLENEPKDFMMSMDFSSLKT